MLQDHKVVIQKNMKNIDELKKIGSTIAVFRGFSPETPISNAVVYYWESHALNADDKEKHQATIELVFKEFDLYTCEKYEIRTGYLKRYNYLSRPMSKSSKEEIEEAIIKGKQEQNDWLDRCDLELPGFQTRNWQECISEERNPHFEGCKELIIEKMQKTKEFADAFSKTVNDYAERRETNIINGNSYMLEELSWMLSLPLLHLNKPVYLVYVGLAGDVIRELFQHFPNLQKAVKWLCPKIRRVTFLNEADFLMDYRNGIHVGYSYAMVNKDIVRPIATFKKEHYSTKEELSQALSREIDEKNMLYSIIEKLPGHVYWLNRDNVYLGCNDLQAKNFGLKSRYEVVGKTNGMLHPKEEADILDKTNTTVMETGVAYEGDELVSFSSGSHRDVLTNKTPLFDVHGKIIGLLGISIDITDRKRAEKLEKQNAIQAKFKILADQIAHDIRTPLLTLDMVLERSIKSLSEKEHIALRDSVHSIRKIMQIFLEYSPDKKEYSDCLHILVSQTIAEVIEKKEHQYFGKNVEFQYSFDPALRFLFIYGNATNFERMISNLINNSVEAFEGKSGIVKISFTAVDNNVNITILDNGKGMPKETVEKLMRNESVITTKVGGSGIGTGQIRDALKEFNGTQFIASTPNVGTKITLTIPKSDKPAWAIEQIVLCKGDIVIILDDDISVHHLWKDRLKKYLSDISLKFFENGQEAADFINACEAKDRLMLLSDYELRNQELNGLEVIQRSNLKNSQSIIVSSIYSRKEIQDKAIKLGIKILPKAFIEHVEIILDEKKGHKLSFAKAKVVVLDDEKHLADLFSDILKDHGLAVDTYYNPRNFLKNLSRYDVNTKIITDNSFGNGMTGDVLAKQLSEKGFKNLCVFTGLVNQEMMAKYPTGTNFIVKGSNDSTKYILRWCKTTESTQPTIEPC